MSRYEGQHQVDLLEGVDLAPSQMELVSGQSFRLRTNSHGLRLTAGLSGLRVDDHCGPVASTRRPEVAGSLAGSRLACVELHRPLGSCLHLNQQNGPSTRANILYN